jgi:membrane fusion protein (multidrug efflux system)
MAGNGQGVRSRWQISLAVGILLTLAAAGFIYWLAVVRGTVYSDDARIDGDLVDMAAQVSGTLMEIKVHEGEHVTQGQVLFNLDQRALEASAAKAQADLESAQAGFNMAQAQYDKAENGPMADEIRAVQALEQKAQAQLELAEVEWSRMKNLYDKGEASTSERDRVRATWESAHQSFQEAKSRLALLRAGTRAEDMAAAKANLEQKQAALDAAKATLNQVKINLDYAEVKAPFNGVVVRRWRDPGAMLAPGTPVLTLLNPATLHVRANVEEKNLAKIELDDPVDISIDAFPRLRLRGRVYQILQATNSQFSLVPSEGVSGTFIKVAQRVPILISLSAPSDLDLGPGLSVEVRIHDRPAAAKAGAVSR